MISMELLIYCFVTGSIYLLAADGLFILLENKLAVESSIPEPMREETGIGWFVTNYIMELLFFVAIPSMGYSFLYVVLPLSGIRAGMAVGLIAFILGAVPLLMGLSTRMKLPMQYLLFSLLGYLVKLAGSLIIIGYLYAL